MIDRELIKLEKKLMEEKYPNFKFFKGRTGKLQNVMWYGEIEICKVSYKVGIRLPNTYPNSRPLVNILDENFSIKDLNTTHKDKNKNLCLFTSDGSENSWFKEYRIIDVVERLKDFLYLYQKGRHKDIHKTIIDPLIDLTDTKKYVVDFDWFPNNTIKAGYIRFENTFTNEDFCYAVGITDYNREGIFSRENVYMNKKEYINREVIKWIYINGEKIDAILNLKSKSDLKRLVTRKQSIKEYYNDNDTKYIIFTGSDKKAILVNNDKKLSFSNIIKINKDRFFARNKNIIDVDKLGEKTVSIFGMGSLGSKIVEMLTRAGISDFVLFDYDQFTPENLSRHTLTTEDLFLNKTTAIERRIKKINPWAKVISLDSTQNLLHFDELYEDIANLLKISDIIICSTGNVESEYDINYIINDICKYKSVPTIFSAILGNGFGGRLHRVEIGKTPCYQCIKLQQEGNPKLYKKFNQDVFLDYDQNKYGIYSEAGIPGLDVDINMVASITVKMVLETLLNKPNPIFKFNSYIWGNQIGWEFNEPFQLKDVRFSKVANCNICGKHI